MSGIIWIASYPKSGSTWFRIFLTNLMRDGSEPVSINDLERTPIASARQMFDGYAGLPSADLLPEEIERLRPSVYELLAEEAEDPLFFKIHDAYTYTGDGVPLVSVNGTRGAIYIIRNPLDVAVSSCHHNKSDIERTIQRMADKENTLVSNKNGLKAQLTQKLLSWSGHVKSWVDAPDLNVHVIRYEDMLNDPLKTFQKAAQFAGLPGDPKRIRKAVNFSGIDNLKRQEVETRFQETPSRVACFFRKGTAGSWREELSMTHARQIISDHRQMMERFGYLTKSGEIVY